MKWIRLISPSKEAFIRSAHALNDSWVVENYYIIDGRILCVEVTIPLMEFLYVTIDDVKEAWVSMLGQFVAQLPGVEMSWSMEPRDEVALVTIRIGKTGDLKKFSPEEAAGAVAAVDALFSEQPKKKASSKKAPAKKKTPKSKK